LKGRVRSICVNVSAIKVYLVGSAGLKTVMREARARCAIACDGE